MITSFSQLDLSKKYTYSDYLTWQFDELVELIRGRVVKMPAPTTLHQSRSGDLYGLIWSHLRDKQCKVFNATFDLRLPLPPEKVTTENLDTVVQPDICAICDLDKLDERGCNGAPDWIIEILSKSTAKKDVKDKFELYEHAGVQEYWIVHPNEETVLAYRLNEQGKYQILRQNPFGKDDVIPSGIFDDLVINLGEVFS